MGKNNNFGSTIDQETLSNLFGKDQMEVQTIDFSKDPHGSPSAPSGGQDDFFYVMKQSESTTIDI